MEHQNKDYEQEYLESQINVYSGIQDPKILEIRQIINFSQNNMQNFITIPKFYSIVKLIGKGSFGKVYLSINKLLNKLVAIKVLNKISNRND